ncbi:MAG: hypothetical protein SFU98_08735 [Leptospiraceae bacterium]|nr:hypothetical protein [Leptospiraceae bacterium]
MRLNYLENPNLSDETGNPKDKEIFYFPEARYYKNLMNDSILPEQFNKFFSKVLHSAVQPVLYNYYSDQEVYRFLWIRAFHNYFVINIKKLNQKFFIDCIELEFNKNKAHQDFMCIVKELQMEVSSVNWVEFERLLDVTNVWKKLIDKNWENTRDGSHWVLEAHKSKYYQFAHFHSPKIEERAALEYLIKLSNLHEIIY